MKIGIYCYFVADILTQLLQKCSLSGSLSNIFVQTSEFDWLPSAEMLNFEKKKTIKNHLLRSHKANIFVLIDLREIFLRFWVRGGEKKIKIKSLKLISQ